MYREMLELEATSSSIGNLYLTNLTIGETYTVDYMTEDIVLTNVITNTSLNFTASNVAHTIAFNWTGPITSNEHAVYATLENSNGDVIGYHDDYFIPQLPSAEILSASNSPTATTNQVNTAGKDLINGDSYWHQVKVVDANGGLIASSTLTNYTATSTNMSFGMFTYSTPNASGQYCAIVALYYPDMTQLIGDSECFIMTFDDDSDGVKNEDDQCPNTPVATVVDSNGCALSQKDSDNDGHNDSVDAFPFDGSHFYIDTLECLSTTRVICCDFKVVGVNCT